MDAQKELERWKAEFIAAKTPEAEEEHKKHFSAFVDSLSPEELEEFTVVFRKGANEAIKEAQELIKAIELKQNT